MKSILLCSVLIATALLAPPPSRATLPPATGLVAWYRADLGVTTNPSGVSLWADQSGNSHDATQGNPSFEPTLATQVIGRLPHPVLALTGGQDLTFTLPGANAYTGMTVIFVASPGNSLAASGYETVVSSGGAGVTPSARWAFGVGSATVQGLGWAGNGAQVDLGSGAILNANAFYMNTYRWNKASNNWLVSASRDDLATAFSDNLTGSGTIADGSSGISGTFNGVLGTELANNSTYALSGYLGEVLIYDHSLNATEFGNVVSYLNDVYFIPEPSTVMLLGCGGLFLWRRFRKG